MEEERRDGEVVRRDTENEMQKKKKKGNVNAK